MTRLVTILGYLLLLAVGMTLIAIPYRRPDLLAPAGQMLDEVMAERAARITILVFWWWLGWHFLVDGTV